MDEMYELLLTQHEIDLMTKGGASIQRSVKAFGHWYEILVKFDGESETTDE